MRSIAQLVSELDKGGLKLWVEEGQVRYRGAEEALKSPEFSELAARKAEALAFLTEVRTDRAIPPFTARPRPERIPLSMGQRLWYETRKQFGPCKDNVFEAHRLEGPLDADLLEEALRLVVQRHEILRTTYGETEDGEAYQVVHEALPPTLERVETGESDPDAAEARGKAMVAEVFWEYQDIAAGPILRCRLIRLDDETHMLVLAMSHIAADGMSLDIIRQEIFYNYHTLQIGEKPMLPPLVAHYADFALWETSWLSGDDFPRHAEYWAERLEGIAPLELPTFADRGDGWSVRGTAPFSLPKETAIAMRAFARENGVTAPMILLAGLHSMFARWSGQDQVLTGVIYNGRPSGAELVVGTFITLRPFYTDLSGDPTFAEAVRIARQAYVETHDPRRPVDIATTRKYELNRVGANIMKVPNVTPDADDEERRVAGLKVTTIDPTVSSGERDYIFDVNLHIRDSPLGVGGYLMFARDWIEEDRIDWLVSGMAGFLNAGMREPERRISELPDREAQA